MLARAEAISYPVANHSKRQARVNLQHGVQAAQEPAHHLTRTRHHLSWTHYPSLLLSAKPMIQARQIAQRAPLAVQEVMKPARLIASQRAATPLKPAAIAIAVAIKFITKTARYS